LTKLSSAVLRGTNTRINAARVVSKRVDTPYRSGRGEHWHKTKCWQIGRFVVVGFAPDGMGGLAKLRLARREGGKLIYAGRVGTGWDYKTAREISAARLGSRLYRARHP
jgi:ATP-dependent DNA ligase